MSQWTPHSTRNGRLSNQQIRNYIQKIPTSGFIAGKYDCSVTVTYDFGVICGHFRCTCIFRCPKCAWQSLLWRIGLHWLWWGFRQTFFIGALARLNSRRLRLRLFRIKNALVWAIWTVPSNLTFGQSLLKKGPISYQICSLLPPVGHFLWTHFFFTNQVIQMIARLPHRDRIVKEASKIYSIDIEGFRYWWLKIFSLIRSFFRVSKIFRAYFDSIWVRILL